MNSIVSELRQVGMIHLRRDETLQKNFFLLGLSLYSNYTFPPDKNNRIQVYCDDLNTSLIPRDNYDGHTTNDSE